MAEPNTAAEAKRETSGWLFVLAIAAGAVGLLLPWAEMTSGFGGRTTLAGTEVRLMNGWMGHPWLLVAVGCLTAALCAHTLLVEHRQDDDALQLGLMAAGFLGVAGLWGAIRVNSVIAKTDLTFGSAKVGIGVWIVIASAIAALAAVFVGNGAKD